MKFWYGFDEVVLFNEYVIENKYIVICLVYVNEVIWGLYNFFKGY